MKTDVKISIRGIQDNADEESVEVVSLGEMYEKGGKIYVSYEEGTEGVCGADCELVKSMLKVCPDQVEIIKKGAAETHIVFV